MWEKVLSQTGLHPTRVLTHQERIFKTLDSIPRIHDLEGRQHMRQSLLFGQVAIQTEEDLCQRGSIRLHVALPAHLVVHC